jgi:hypothetical protein
MFPAKRTRHDILMPLSALATRLQKATQEDMDALTHVYVYISLTLDLGLTFHTQSMQLHYWIDAAYALHSDKRGHTGILATLGSRNAPIYAKSAKQKIHSRSSTEAELLALDDGFLHLLWLRQVLDFMGYPQVPTYVYQDNKSTIFVCETGHSKNGKLKHMAIRYYFIHGHLENNIAKLKYCKTEEMIADILTKPFNNSKSFIPLRNKMLNHQ